MADALLSSSKKVIDTATSVASSSLDEVKQKAKEADQQIKEKKEKKESRDAEESSEVNEVEKKKKKIEKETKEAEKKEKEKEKEKARKKKKKEEEEDGEDEEEEEEEEKKMSDRAKQAGENLAAAGGIRGLRYGIYSYFHQRLGYMVHRFSDNTVHVAEKLGRKLDDITDTSSGDRCDHVSFNREISDEDVKTQDVAFKEYTKRFLDYVQIRSPELYDKIKTFTEAFADRAPDSVTERKHIVGDFFDPFAYFQDKRSYYYNSHRVNMALARNRTRSSMYGYGGIYYMYMYYLRRATSSKEGMHSYLDNQLEHLKRGRRARISYRF